MTRPHRPRLGSSGADSTVHREDGQSRSARPRCEHSASRERATPESKAKEVLKQERARQRTAIRRTDATRGEMALTTSVLKELLSDPAFVALLRAQGLTSIPKLIHQRLMEQR